MGGYELYKRTNEYQLIGIGNLVIMKERGKHWSQYVENNESFNYHGIENALFKNEFFTPKRILVIQMK